MPIFARPLPLATLAAATMALFGAPPPAAAFNPQADPPARLGDVSLTAGQTLRLNARVTQQLPAVQRDAAQPACKVTLGFDSGGRGVGQVLIALLRPGQGARLDLVGSEHTAAGQALAVQPSVRVLPAVQSGALPAVQSCAVAVTLEVLDERGHVVAVVADPRLVTPDSAGP